MSCPYGITSIERLRTPLTLVKNERKANLTGSLPCSYRELYAHHRTATPRTTKVNSPRGSISWK